MPLFAIFDERQSGSEHIEKFVIVRMPVARAQPSAWRQVHEIDTEISEPAGITRRCPTRSTQSASGGDGWYEPVGCGTAAMSTFGMTATL